MTGASRGIGAAIVDSALAAEGQVAATARDPRKVEDRFREAGDRLLALELDVTNEAQVKKAVEAAVAKFGRIDVLVNNAGYGQLGIFEETTPAAINAQYETNVFGLMNVTRAVLPILRKQGSGRIINISSVAGLKGVMGGSIYNSSKFAVEGFSQALADELAPLGIYVTAVSPGFFRTDFLDASSVRYAGGGISDYAHRLAEFRGFHDDRNHTQAGDPAKLGRVIVHLAGVDNPPVSFMAGSDAVEWANRATKDLKDQIDRWRDLSVSTDGQ